MVHRREIDGQAIVLGNQGDLWGNAMTWWDHETGSIWSQPVGEAILGPLKGERLELLPSTMTEWADWRAAHPDTLALEAPSDGNRFDLDDMAVVVEFGRESTAFMVPELRATELVNAEVNGVPLAVVLLPNSDNWEVFSRTLDDRVVELQLIDGVLVETDGPGRWDADRGLGVDGTDQNLDPLPGFTSFPNDYLTFFPSGDFWP